MKKENPFTRVMQKLSLYQELDTPEYKAFRLSEEGTRIDSCRIVFTPEGIILHGDLCPESNKGAVSNFGYGLDWFSRPQSGDYLCSKFLGMGLVPERAIEEIQEWIDHYEEYEGEGGGEEWEEEKAERIEALQEVIEGLDCGDMGPERLYDALSEISHSLVDDGIPGWYYPTRDANLLIAIQRRFVELYHTDLRRPEE